MNDPNENQPELGGRLPADACSGFVVVARLRLPISIRNLKLSVDAFIKIHGRGLTMTDTQDGWLEIRKPNGSVLAPDGPKQTL